MLPTDLHQPGSTSPITYAKLLVVEGIDPWGFFKALLQTMDLLSEVEIRNYGGIKELTDYLNTLRVTPGFRDVVSLGIVRDAEIDAKSAFQSVRDSLACAELPVPEKPKVAAPGTPATSVFILPDCEKSGMLETLCLEAVTNDPAIPCVEDYFDCLKRSGIDVPSNLAKAQTHAFLASRSKPGLSLRWAAREGYWPWTDSAFDGLKAFVRAL
jgi:hypothetical protein